MNKKRKALSGFKRVRDVELLVHANTVLQSLQDNEFFPETDPELPVLKAGIEDYTEKLSEARKKGSPFDTEIKRESRERLETIMGELAFYVNKTAKGNLSIILSSGFSASSTTSVHFEPEIITNVKLSDGRQSGQIRLDFEKQTNTLIYEYCYTGQKDEEGELIWSEIFKTTSTRANIISPAMPGTRYYVKVRGVNNKGIGEWSEPVSMMAR